MKVSVRGKRSKLVFQISVTGGCFLIALFTVLYSLTPSFENIEAEKRIRLLLLTKLSQKHISILKASGKALPSQDMAKQWEKEIRDIKKLKFSSVVVNRFIPDLLFNEYSPSWVVRVVVNDANQQPRHRYFWLGHDGIDRETSRILWLFTI